MSINNLSQLNQQFIQQAAQNNGTVNQTPIYTTNTPSVNLETSPTQDTFVKKNKTKLVAGGILGAAAIAIGAFFLAKNGKLGAKAQEFAGNLFSGSTKLQLVKDGKTTALNSKGKTFYNLKETKNANGETIFKKTKASRLQLQDGVFTDKKGKPFNGVMEFKNKDGNLIQNSYKDGQIVEVKKDGAVVKTIGRSGNITVIFETDGNGKILTTLTKTEYPGYTIINNIKNLLSTGKKQVIIPDDKSFIQINETVNMGNTEKFVSHKIFDTKTKQVIQEGKPRNIIVYGDRETLLEIQNGNKKYQFNAEVTEGIPIFPNIVQSEANTFNSNALPTIHELLPNGVTKFVNGSKTPGYLPLESGFSFPDGTLIELDKEGGLYIMEKIIDGKGVITGIPTREKSEYITKSIKSAIQTALPEGITPKEYGKAQGLEPLKQEERDILFNFLKKFALSKEDSKIFRPEIQGARIATEAGISEALEAGADREALQKLLPVVENILKYFEANGI